MIGRKFLLLTMLALCVAMSARAVDTEQRLIDSRFRTLTANVEGCDMCVPVYILGSAQRIEISFDELADERRYLRYELIHCDADWQPSGLVDSEFLDGFNQGDIDDYAYSQATTVNYVHYRLQIPNEQVSPKLSGNYLVRVYDEADPSATLLQSRFSVSEGIGTVAGEVTSRTDVDYNDKHHQLNFVVDFGQEHIANPIADLKVRINQNSRSDRRMTIAAPQRVDGQRVYYEHLRSNIFPAGNEYRRFESVTTQFNGLNVAAISYEAPYYHVELMADKPRSQTGYVYDKTQHGRFRVREYNADNSDVEADYMVVHFSLVMPELKNHDVYLEGDLTQRCLDQSSVMHYDHQQGAYKRALMLKQGAYNYQYVAVAKHPDTKDDSIIEGDYYPTQNEYAIKVYYRPPGQRYDRLLNVAQFNSGQ